MVRCLRVRRAKGFNSLVPMVWFAGSTPVTATTHIRENSVTDNIRLLLSKGFNSPALSTLLTRVAKCQRLDCGCLRKNITLTLLLGYSKAEVRHEKATVGHGQSLGAKKPKGLATQVHFR